MDVEHPLPAVIAHVHDLAIAAGVPLPGAIAGGAVHPGVVDQHGDRPEAIVDVGEHGLDGLAVGHVAGRAHGFAPVGNHLIGGGRSGRLVQVLHHDLGALAGE